MHIDIIVPNFDESSDEVTLSTWYKKVGDKISKDEIVADAETPYVACGITSGYEAILIQILAPEGAMVTQGTKIAVIETDLNADISQYLKEQEKAEALKESQAIGEQIEKEIEESKAAEVQIPPPPPPPPAKEPEPEPKVEEPQRTPEEEARREEIREEIHKEVAKNEIQDEIEEDLDEEFEEEEAQQETSVSSSDSSEYSLSSASEPIGTSQEIEEKVSDGEIPSNVAKKVENEIGEYRDEKIITIITDAEKKAKEEAKTLTEKILEDTKKTALQQSEELKAKILHEYEERALKDASEMHQKIIEGSLAEADSTRTKLVDEAREKALAEAEEVKNKILEAAKEEAQKAANQAIEEAVAKAQDEAREKAEIAAREIIEKAIRDSNSEAKSIKKNAIRSANRHATKEAETIMKKIMDEAKKTSKEQAKSVVNATTHLAIQEAEALRNEILQQASREILNSVKETVSEVTKDACERLKTVAWEEFERAKRETRAEIQNFLRSELFSQKGRELIEEIKQTTIEKQAISEPKIEPKPEIKSEPEPELKSEPISEPKPEVNLESIVGKEPEPAPEQKLASDMEEKELIRKLLNEVDEKESPEMYADNWQKPKYFPTPGDKNVPVDLLTKRINERMKSSIDSSVVSTVSNEVDMSAIIAMEKSFGAAFTSKHNTRLGFTPFFISAAIAALKQYPVFNAHIRNDEIIYKSGFDISIITCGNDGVEAPVIRNADKLSIAELEKTMIALSQRAVEGTLSVEEVSGGTFTVVNAGIYGSLMGTDLLTSPQVATLSIHRMHNRPIATENGVEVKPVLYISLSYDHRIADTKKASEFLSNVKSYVENPGWQILGL